MTYMDWMVEDNMDLVGTVSAEKEGNGHYALHKNGHPAYCPFVPPVLVPDRFGNATFSRVGCTTGCPHANLYKRTDEGVVTHEYIVTCSDLTANYKVEIKPEEEDGAAKDSMLVRL